MVKREEGGSGVQPASISPTPGLGSQHITPSIRPAGGNSRLQVKHFVPISSEHASMHRIDRERIQRHAPQVDVSPIAPPERKKETFEQETFRNLSQINDQLKGELANEVARSTELLGLYTEAQGFLEQILSIEGALIP